jgi:hypothetical protein
MILVNWEGEMGGYLSQAGPDRIERPYLKNKLKQKRLGPQLKQ